MSEIFQNKGLFTLESGKQIADLHLSYTCFGQLNAAKDNVVWVFHALTANDNPLEWWAGLVGEGCIISPDKYFIVCVNMPGSCYGSISPLSINKQTNQPYYHSFPWFTTRDMIRSYQLLKNYLGINRIKIGIGGSMGGQQLLEWAIESPTLFEYIIPIATNAFHSPWGIAFNTSQRMCIEADSTWGERQEFAGQNGLKAARSLALLSYRNYATYTKLQKGFTEQTAALPIDEQVFRAETYQQYQGEKLVKRFNAFSYYVLTKAMDSHNVGRNRGGVEAALQSVQAKTLVISIATDMLFPIQEQVFVAQHIPHAKYVSVDSLYGHDGFLLEFAQIENKIRAFVE